MSTQEKSTTNSRRKLLKNSAWVVPVVMGVSLPQHAQATTVVTTTPQIECPSDPASSISYESEVVELIDTCEGPVGAIEETLEFTLTNSSDIDIEVTSFLPSADADIMTLPVLVPANTGTVTLALTRTRQCRSIAETPVIVARCV